MYKNIQDGRKIRKRPKTKKGKGLMETYLKFQEEEMGKLIWTSSVTSVLTPQGNFNVASRKES
jgi:hypothetical protein